jgi:hypothetical protein
VKVLATRPEIDPQRIGLPGHSRGGSAVLTAVTRRFCEAIHDRSVRAALAAYPWSGHQFLDPDVGATEVRAIVGDRDDWVSPQQIQGHVQAIRLRGGTASIRIVAGAEHSFDRHEPLQKFPDAAVSPGALTSYLADDGAFIHPTTGEADAKLVDRDLAVYALKTGYGVRGATIGSQGDQAALFCDDMRRFFHRALLTRQAAERQAAADPAGRLSFRSLLVGERLTIEERLVPAHPLRQPAGDALEGDGADDVERRAQQQQRALGRRARNRRRQSIDERRYVERFRAHAPLPHRSGTAVA